MFYISCNKTLKVKPLILVVLPTNDNPFWIDMSRGIEDGIQKLNQKVDLRLHMGSADTDVQRQIEVMNSYLNSGKVDALILGPSSSAHVIPTVAQFIRKNIPVIIVDSKLDSVSLKEHGIKVDLFIGSQNEKGGQKAAERIESIIGSNSKTILIIEGSPVHETALARQIGFIKAAPKSWKIIEKRGDWDRSEANRVTRSVLTSELPDAIFCASDEMAMGVIAALNSNGISADNWPIIIGFDATDDGLLAIESGEMCATIKQDPFGIGHRAVTDAYGLIQGELGIRGEIFIDLHIIPEPSGSCGK